MALMRNVHFVGGQKDQSEGVACSGAGQAAPLAQDIPAHCLVFSTHQAQGVLKCCGSGREVVRLALRSLQPGGIQCSHKDYDKRHKLQMPRECSYKIL